RYVRIERRVVVGTGGAGDAVRRPGVEVAAVAVVRAMPITAGHDSDVVVATIARELRDRGCYRGAALDREAAAFAEVVLHVDDEPRASHPVCRRTGPPPGGCCGRAPCARAWTCAPACWPPAPPCAL